VMIHCVRAYPWLLQIMKSEGKAPQNFLLHGYSGSREQVAQFISLGAYFSFSGRSLTNRAELRNVLKAIPVERILVETDAPNGTNATREAPAEKENKAHPAGLLDIIKGLGAATGCAPASLVRQLTDNSRTFFGPLLTPRQAQVLGEIILA
jgi:TatD DNase family protein